MIARASRSSARINVSCQSYLYPEDKEKNWYQPRAAVCQTRGRKHRALRCYLLRLHVYPIEVTNRVSLNLIGRGENRGIRQVFQVALFVLDNFWLARGNSPSPVRQYIRTFWLIHVKWYSSKTSLCFSTPSGCQAIESFFSFFPINVMQWDNQKIETKVNCFWQRKCHAAQTTNASLT